MTGPVAHGGRTKRWRKGDLVASQVPSTYRDAITLLQGEHTMNGQLVPPTGPPLYGLIKFLAVIGLMTIFALGIAIGVYLAGAF